MYCKLSCILVWAHINDLYVCKQTTYKVLPKKINKMRTEFIGWRFKLGNVRSSIIIIVVEGIVLDGTGWSMYTDWFSVKLWDNLIRTHLNPAKMRRPDLYVLNYSTIAWDWRIHLHNLQTIDRTISLSRFCLRSLVLLLLLSFFFSFVSAVLFLILDTTKTGS